VLLHRPGSGLSPEPIVFCRTQACRSLWPSAIMASSSRRAFIGHLVFAKAAEAGGDRMTPSRPPLTATPTAGNSGAPLEHLFTRRFARLEFGSRVGFASWNLLFSQMGPRWAGRSAGSGSEPWGPQPTPWPTAAPGGTRHRAGRGSSAPPLELRTHMAYHVSLGGVVPSVDQCVLQCVRGVFVVDSDAKRRKNSVFGALAPSGGRR
jgi:hypothetical protein